MDERIHFSHTVEQNHNISQHTNLLAFPWKRTSPEMWCAHMCTFRCLSKLHPLYRYQQGYYIPDSDRSTLAAVAKNCNNSGAIKANSLVSWLNENETNPWGWSPHNTEDTVSFWQRAKHCQWRSCNMCFTATSCIHPGYRIASITAST